MTSAIDNQVLEWVGRLGAVSAGDVALRFDLSARSARARLSALQRAGLVHERRLLHGLEPLYVASRSGLRLVGLSGLGPCRVSASSFAHWQACAKVAVYLERRNPGRVSSDRELRQIERQLGAAVASAQLGFTRSGEPGWHHPDLVVWPADPEGLPRAVEVELTAKGARRLQAICRAWARTRRLAGVEYYASGPALPALTRAIAAVDAHEWVSVVPLAVVEEALAGGPRLPNGESLAAASAG
jgi:hypothetical protein